MTSAEVAFSADELVALTREDHMALVEMALESIPNRLTFLVEHAELDAIREIKVWAVQLADSARERGLIVPILQDAWEVARRAERALGVAVRAAQNRGDIGQGTGLTARGYFDSNREHNDCYEMERVSDEEFSAILKLAREEGRLTRRYVADMSRAKSGFASKSPEPDPPANQIDHLAQLAVQGATSAQIGERLNLPAAVVRRKAKAAGIELPADRVTAKTHKINPERVVQETVNTLLGLEYGLNILTVDDYAELPADLASEWLRVLDGPMRAIRKMTKELKTNVNS